MPQLDVFILYNQVIFVFFSFWVLYFLNVYLFLFNINKSLKIKQKILNNFFILDSIVIKKFINYNLKSLNNNFLLTLIKNCRNFIGLFNKNILLLSFSGLLVFFKNISLKKYQYNFNINSYFFLFFNNKLKRRNRI